jgi:hypothetical protein
MQFEVEGSKGSSMSLSAFVLILGVIGSLTMFIVALAIPDRVGPWWIYVITFAASIAYGVRTFKNDKVIVRVLDGKLKLSGPTTAIEVALPSEAAHWISFVKGPHVGAKRIVQYNVVVESGGKKLGFWNLCGSEGSEPADWPVQSGGVSCDEQFLCPRLDELVRVIQSTRS